jgi:hypothetical protein
MLTKRLVAQGYIVITAHMDGRKLDRIITALCHHIKIQKVVANEPVSAIIPLVIEEQPVLELPLKRMYIIKILPI